MKPLTGLPVDSLVQVSEASNIPLKQLHELVQQIENGASVAFLSRYRADLCGGHSEEKVQEILRSLHQKRDLMDRRIAILADLGQKGVLTDDLKARIERSADRRELNDLFQPYRQRDMAELAVEIDLDPLARVLWFQKDGIDIEAEASKYLAPDKGLAGTEQVLAKAYEIAARWLSEKPEILGELRKLYHRECSLSVSVRPQGMKEPRWQELNGFQSLASQVSWQKMLSIRRGRRAGVLEMTVESPHASASEYLRRRLVKDPSSPYVPHLERIVDSALSNGLSNRVRKDVLAEIDETADRQAIEAFCQNLSKALLAPPAHGLSILGIDTGRGSKWAAVLIDSQGRFVDQAIVFQERQGAGRGREAVATPPTEAADAPPAQAETDPVAPAVSAPGDTKVATESAGSTPESAVEPKPDAVAASAPAPSPPRRGAKSQPPKFQDLSEFLRAHDVDLIVFNAPPRSAKVERTLRSHIRRSGKTRIAWRAVRDFGAEIYATSRNGKRDLGKLHPAFRTAATLARRAQDPLAELVKADPKTLGIGVNHQEVNPEQLAQALRRTVECVVHDAGVDANRANADLLAFVPGVVPGLARRIVQHRRRSGPFQRREDLKKVEGFSARIFAQAAGFLRVYGDDPFDGTGGHPDYRELYDRIAAAAECDLATLLAEPERLDTIDPEQFATQDRSLDCIRAAISELRPERRNLRKPFQMPSLDVPLRTDEELAPGSKVSGIVKSVADFGAFVDIGADKDALLHVSQIRREQVQDQKPAFAIGESVEAFVRFPEQEGKGIALSMWDPASRPPRPRNGAGRAESMPRPDGGRSDRPRRRDGRRSDRSDRRAPYRQVFGPGSEDRRRSSRRTGKLTKQEQLDMLQDRYRTKV